MPSIAELRRALAGLVGEVTAEFLGPTPHGS